MNLKTLQEYAEFVLQHRDHPHTLADINLEMAAKYAFVAGTSKPVKLKKAEYWQKKYTGTKPLSDVYLKTQWENTPDGIEEIKIKIELDGLEKLMSGVKSYLVQASIEAKSQQ